jgi:hypothetical protein
VWGASRQSHVRNITARVTASKNSMRRSFSKCLQCCLLASGAPSPVTCGQQQQQQASLRPRDWGPPFPTPTQHPRPQGQRWGCCSVCAFRLWCA